MTMLAGQTLKNEWENNGIVGLVERVREMQGAGKIKVEMKGEGWDTMGETKGAEVQGIV